MEYLKHMVAADDASAILSELMDLYGQDVWNYAYFLTKRRDAADDISQEVFLKAFRHLHDFQGRSSVKTWLLTITRNISFNYLKSSFISRVMLLGRNMPDSSMPSAEMEYMDTHAVSRIWKLVMQLPAKYREVLILESHYHLTRKEMSELLNIAEGTIKSRLHRARARMEELLKGEDMP
ncbi:sigma-70 family RNA polymerase sigma factor [Paenibacillus sp. JCM 10914]